jgi:hypothetical protein
MQVATIKKHFEATICVSVSGQRQGQRTGLYLSIYIYIKIYSIRPQKHVILVFREIKQFEL